jgi:hypothetical protein
MDQSYLKNLVYLKLHDLQDQKQGYEGLLYLSLKDCYEYILPVIPLK